MLRKQTKTKTKQNTHTHTHTHTYTNTHTHTHTRIISKVALPADVAVLDRCSLKFPIGPTRAIWGPFRLRVISPSPF